jgi:cellulose synthase operon protein C
MPSDFPAALGELDESDLPVVSAGLPTAKPRTPPVKAPVVPPSAPPTPIDELDFDLPSLASDLPVARPKPPVPAKPPPKPPAAPVESDLPVLADDLPMVRGAALEARNAAYLSDLPVISNMDLPARPGHASPGERDPHSGLPVLAASAQVRADAKPGLPALAASLPSRAQENLPAPAAALPVPLDSLPAPARRLGGNSFGEIELPTIGEPFPPPAAHEAPLPPPPPPSPPLGSVGDAAFGLFGEIDLPHESPPSSPRRAPAGIDSADFGDLELDDRRRSVRPVSIQPSAPTPKIHSNAPKAAGGMSFGEVDIGGGEASEAGAIGIDSLDQGERAEAQEASVAMGASAAASAPARIGPANRVASVRPPPKRSVAKTVAFGISLVVVLAGTALQLTPYGAFGYLKIGDLVHAGDYRRATAAAIADTDRATGPDTYDGATSALDALDAARARSGRARSLAAYAAFADYATSVRFGADAARPSRAQQLLSSLPSDEPVEYRDAALAAQAAAGGDLAKARSAVDDATTHLQAGDPLQGDLALVAGELALDTGDGTSALAAFKRAQALSNDARAHFGMARAYDRLGDATNAKQEVEATLAASPGHPGALTLRARPKSFTTDPGKALADLAVVLEGPSRAKASPEELSYAYAAKAWVSLDRGAATEAREAFAQSVALDPRNVDALNGEGRLFLNEERFTEALARFDTALGIDESSPETIANDAEAKIALERLADAKQQLAAAREKFPKSIPILMLLGKVEQHLGNSDAAEADLRAAIALVDPARPDGVLPYVALSKLLSEKGRLPDARAVLDDAKKKLTPSSALERAFGEISELQGAYDGAIAYYRAALEKDPKNATTHFRIGVALRKVRKFDEAATELDKVAAVDKDFPGLSLERGLLFQESGDVQKAIEQFNGALAKAPDDPDLQLRVGAAYVVIGRPDEALPVLRKVLEKRPTSAEAHYYVGRAMMGSGGPGQADALRYLKRAVELDPNRAEFHVYVAWAANDAMPAQLELARDEIDRALALDNLNAEAYWQRGVLERMEGAVEDAMKDEEHALALRPSRYEARATLAECYEDKNQEALALAEWARAIAGDAEGPDPDTVRHPYWRFRYGKLLTEHGGTAAALGQLAPAVETAEKITPKPGWLAPLEFLTAEALRKTGKKADAVEHYKRFLEIAPVNSPDRLDAQQALTTLSPR